MAFTFAILATTGPKSFLNQWSEHSVTSVSSVRASPTVLTAVRRFLILLHGSGGDSTDELSGEEQVKKYRRQNGQRQCGQHSVIIVDKLT